MKHLVGVADMRISGQTGDLIVTHALGSCLGIAIHDPVAKIGGILHAMLPTADLNPEKARENPFMFIDSGVPLLFKRAYAEGAQKARLIVKVAGGAAIGDTNDYFAIGKRNFVMLRKLFWKNGVMIEKADVGGSRSRTLYLEVGTGRIWVHSDGQTVDL
ncbi:MAG: chemotaxis protein CheD [Planctomycetes bacterium]|nr:chemotaxis protein CheD [Planctomycetota bacterium]